jgi:hypothetical protein
MQSRRNHARMLDGSAASAGPDIGALARVHGADPTEPPELDLAAMERASSRTAAAAVRMQLDAQQLRHRADRAEERGDIVGPHLDRREAKQLEHEAELALDPMLHCTGPVTVGNGGEMAIGTKAMAPFIDTVRERPGMLAVDASRHRMELADKADVLTLAVDAAETIQAANSLEKMLVHQMAAAHTMAMKAQAEARELLNTHKRTGYVHQHLSIEAGRMMNASARMMESYQHGMLTLAKIRSGGQQTVVVQHVNVGDGGRAMVAGQVKLRGKRRHEKAGKAEGETGK